MTSAGTETKALRGMLDLLEDGVVLVDADWRLTLVNAVAADLLGAPSDALTGRCLWEVDLCPLATADEAAYRRAMAGEPQALDPRRIDAPSGSRWLATRLLPRPGGLAVLLRDVTAERARDDRAGADRPRDEFSVTFDQAPIGIAHTDRDHRWLRFNRKLCEITGYSAEELRRLDWRAITHPDDLPAQLALERRMLDGEIPGFTIEKRYLRRDGSVVWVRLATATVRQDGDPIYSVAMIEEIGERKRAEAHAAFLAELDELARGGEDGDEVAATATRALGLHLGVSRCALFDVDPDAVATLLRGWEAPGARPLAGAYRLDDAVTPEALDRLRAGQTVAVDDIATDPAAGESAMARAHGVEAWVLAPRVDAAGWRSGIAVHSATPRRWTADEVSLLGDVVTRVWPVIERARAADELRRSEERYRAIVRATAGTVFRLDRDGRVDDAFAAWWRELTGESRAELSGWGWLDAVVPEDRARVRDEQGRGIAELVPFESAYRMTTRAGEERHLVVHRVPLFDGDGTVREWFGTITDVTDQRRQEAALARQASLLDQAYDAFLAWELDGPIVYWNQGAERLYGYARAEALGRNSHELLRTAHPGGRDAVLAELEATGAIEVEIAHVARDGRTVTVRSRHQLVQDGTRRIVLEVNRDVTELKALERAQQDFMAAASHDLKNPISVVRAETQLMLRNLRRGDRPDPDRLVRGLATVERVSAAMAGLVDDLVDVAVLRSGRPVELALGRADLVALVERAAALHRPRYGGEIIVHTPETPVEAAIDERRLDRVVENLLANAVKFSPGLGAIRVEFRTTERVGRPMAQIIVRDAGVGIPAGDLAVVFEGFRRGSNVAGVAGTGIGLSGARQIVELHGGRITVESTEGAGSAFTVTLPLA